MLEQAVGVARECGALLRNWPGPWEVSVCFLCLVPRSRRVCTRVLREWSLNFFELSCKYYWFSNHLRGLVFLVLDPRGRVSNMWFESFMPQGGSPSPGYLSHFLCPILGLQVLTWSLLLPSFLTLCGSLQPFSRRVFLPVLFVFSESCSSCSCIFDVFMGGNELKYPSLPLWSPPLLGWWLLEETVPLGSSDIVVCHKHPCSLLGCTLEAGSPCGCPASGPRGEPRVSTETSVI